MLMVVKCILICKWHTPHSLKDSNASPKMKTKKKEGIRVCSLACHILGVNERVGAPGWGLKQTTSNQLFTQTKQQVG